MPPEVILRVKKAQEHENLKILENTRCLYLAAVASNLAFFQIFQVPETKNYLYINYYLATFASRSHFEGEKSTGTWKPGILGKEKKIWHSWQTAILQLFLGLTIFSSQNIYEVGANHDFGPIRPKKSASRTSKWAENGQICYFSLYGFLEPQGGSTLKIKVCKNSIYNLSQQILAKKPGSECI